MADTYLTLALAKSIAEHNPLANEMLEDFLDLSDYEAADPEAIKFLSGQGQRGCLMLGLTELDVEVATIIASWSANVNLTKLTHMSREVATILAVNWNVLSFDGLLALDVEVAEELAKNKSHLYISLQENLSLDVARVLATHAHELRIEVATKPPLHVQQALLFSYMGIEVTLRYPFDRTVSANDFVAERCKQITVERVKDMSGNEWTDITATDDVDRWQARIKNLGSPSYFL
jgi:hypothetical protein